MDDLSLLCSSLNTVTSGVPWKSVTPPQSSSKYTRTHWHTHTQANKPTDPQTNTEQNNPQTCKAGIG